MSIIVEVITELNQADYRMFLFEDHPYFQKDHNSIVLGVISQQKPLGIITVEVKNEKAIIIDYNSKQLGITETCTGCKIVEQVEKILSEKGLNYIFWFHSEQESITKILKLRNWHMNSNQTEYMIDPSMLLQSPVVAKLPSGFDIIRFDTMNKSVLSQLIAAINQQLDRETDQLPPANRINPVTSAFLIYEQKVVGWFISSPRLKQEEPVLSIERFWIKPDFREYKVSASFIKHMIVTIHQEQNYQKLAFNLMDDNIKLAKVIKNGFLGDVQYEKNIFRSYKKIR